MQDQMQQLTHSTRTELDREMWNAGGGGGESELKQCYELQLSMEMLQRFQSAR